MDYHPFELIKLVSGHTRTTAGRPESILAPMDNKCHPFRFRSQHIPLSRFRAIRAFSPTNSNIKSTSEWTPRSRCYTSPQATTIRQFPPPPRGQYSTLERNYVQFF